MGKRLSSYTVALIRSYHADGMQQFELSAKFELSAWAISRIVNGHIYPRIKAEAVERLTAEGPAGRSCHHEGATAGSSTNGNLESCETTLRRALGVLEVHRQCLVGTTEAVERDSAA